MELLLTELHLLIWNETDVSNINMYVYFLFI